MDITALAFTTICSPLYLQVKIYRYSHLQGIDLADRFISDKNNLTPDDRVGRYYDISSKSCQYPLAIQLLHVINLTDIIVSNINRITRYNRNTQYTIQLTFNAIKYEQEKSCKCRKDPSASFESVYILIQMIIYKRKCTLIRIFADHVLINNSGTSVGGARVG